MIKLKNLIPEQISIGNPRKKFYKQSATTIDREFCKDIPDSILIKTKSASEDRILEILKAEGFKRIVAQMVSHEEDGVVMYNDIKGISYNNKSGQYKVTVTLINGKQFDASFVLEYCLKAYDLDDNKPLYRGCFGKCKKQWPPITPVQGIPSQRDY